MTPSALYARPVITDLTVRFFSTPDPPSTHQPDPQKWHRIKKELYLHTYEQQSAWLYIALADEKDFADEDLLVTDIRVGECPINPSSGPQWESRPGGIWVLRRNFSGKIDQAVTDVDVLFGVDAVDPRLEWGLMESTLCLEAKDEVPVARLSVRHGRTEPTSDARAALRVGEDGIFKIVQFSDMHMGIGVGSCKDAIDANGRNLPESEADPRTVKFIEEILDVEKPDFVVLAGDQVHHDVSDSQSAMFKVVAPIIKRSIPFAAVFGNHDSEGEHALTRTEQMSILQHLPFSLCESGPEPVDGIGNFHLQILAPAPSQVSMVNLYFLDSHGQIPSERRNPDYDPIKQSQIDWFTSTCQAQRSAREKDDNGNRLPLSLLFQHIPLPEFGDHRLRIHNGHRGEPTEGPSSNTHFYDALVKEGISAFGCGHDHVNDFCALLPQRTPQDGNRPVQLGPWLCYGGASGFGGYCSYGKKRFHRKARVWEFNTNDGRLETWTRVEYIKSRVDSLVLVKNGVVVDIPRAKEESRNCVVN